MIEKCCPGSLDLHAISCCVLVACSTWHGLCTSCKSFASSRGATAHISCLIDSDDGWASRYDSKWVTPKMDDWIQSILTSLWSKNGNHSHVQNKPSTQGQHLKGTKNRCYIQRIWGPQWATGQPRPGLSGSGMSSFSKQTWKVSLPNHNIHNILEPYSRYVLKNQSKWSGMYDDFGGWNSQLLLTHKIHPTWAVIPFT